MCGILLNIGPEKIRPDHPALEIIKHRGPDDQGAENFAWNDLNIGLGHRRLAIIDLSEGGHQPMSYADDKFWITYNGEIYNYLELRQELITAGHSFQSESDTEVLLAAYAEWGSKCLERLNGMFAFAVYDKSARKIFLARDCFGIKPLYFCNRPNSFRAGSEIKQFLSLPDFQPQVNRETLYHLLNTGDFCFSRETLLQNISEMPPGHYAEINLNQWQPGQELQVRQWYQLPDKTGLNIPLPEAIEEFHKLLGDAVKLRLRADVPVGSLLSGGIDSSTLVSLASRENSDLHTFSSCFDEPGIDEREYLDTMLGTVKSPNSRHFLQPEEVSENLDNVIWHNDLPVRFGSPLPQWLLYRHILQEDQDRKVIFEGTGGDEILGGYGNFYWAHLYELLRPGSLLEFFCEFRKFNQQHQQPLKITLRKLRNLSSSRQVPSHSALKTEFFFPDGKISSSGIRRETATVDELHRSHFTILRYILHNTDRNSMAHSRETRLPFLDHHLVEFFLQLPNSAKIKDGLSKHILREAVKDELPEKILQRPDKQGYFSPIGSWSGNKLQPWFRENLAEAVKLDFVKTDQIMTGFDAFCRKPDYFNPLWWRLINVNRWRKMFKISW